MNRRGAGRRGASSAAWRSGAARRPCPRATDLRPSAIRRSPGRGRSGCGSRGCAWLLATRPGTWRRGVRRASDRVRPAVAGADSDGLLDVGDENLAVADAAGARGILDRLDGIVGERILDHHLDVHLGQEVDDIFGAAIELGVAFLAPEALDLADGDAADPDVVKRVLH